jgi:regulator of nucleoside diphosphate kinase
MIGTVSHTNAIATSAIVLSADDYRGLTALVQSQAANLRMSELAERLAEELGRAQVLETDHSPEQIVGMNCEVAFRDENTGAVQTLSLVYPRDADIAKSRLSVLTPVGTALIGQRVGDVTTWESPAGLLRKLTVLSVRHPRQ